MPAPTPAPAPAPAPAGGQVDIDFTRLTALPPDGHYQRGDGMALSDAFWLDGGLVIWRGQDDPLQHRRWCRSEFSPNWSAGVGDVVQIRARLDDLPDWGPERTHIMQIKGLQVDGQRHTDTPFQLTLEGGKVRGRFRSKEGVLAIGPYWMDVVLEYKFLPGRHEMEAWINGQLLVAGSGPDGAPAFAWKVTAGVYTGEHRHPSRGIKLFKMNIS